MKWEREREITWQNPGLYNANILRSHCTTLNPLTAMVAFILNGCVHAITLLTETSAPQSSWMNERCIGWWISMNSSNPWDSTEERENIVAPPQKPATRRPYEAKERLRCARYVMCQTQLATVATAPCAACRWRAASSRQQARRQPSELT